MPSMDNVMDVLELVESQGFGYVLAIIQPKPANKKQDQVTIYSSLSEDAIDKLIDFLKKTKKRNAENAAKKEEPKQEVKTGKK